MAEGEIKMAFVRMDDECEDADDVDEDNEEEDDEEVVEEEDDDDEEEDEDEIEGTGNGTASSFSSVLTVLCFFGAVSLSSTALRLVFFAFFCATSLSIEKKTTWRVGK